MKVPEIEQKILKNFFVFEIIAFESGAAVSHSLEQDTCHWQSMSYETPLRFSILVRGIFSKWVFQRKMKKFDKSALMQISQVFKTL